MTLVASLLFVTALATSIGVIALTLRDAMPRIVEVIETEFASAMQIERKIVFGEVKGLNGMAAKVVVFPARALVISTEYKLAA